ncbi:MAG: amidohydrolase family protein [Pseudomonadota bacterium]
MHIHFNWSQKEIISARAVVDKLEAANVSFAVVSSTPSELALELRRVGGEKIIPFFSPYTHELGKRDWHLNPKTIALAKTGLQKRQYYGIGEVHFMAGFRPDINNSIFRQLIALALEFKVPMLVHVDAGNENIFLNLCQQNPDLKMLIAHAGGNLKAAHIRKIIDGCDNVMIEFSARDPWRYDGLTNENQLLQEDWRRLVLEFPRRFMIGTDPVWTVTRTQSWDQADNGWDYFELLIEYHRNWISDLPSEVQQLVRIDNARQFFQFPSH